VGNREIDFLGKAITVISESGPDVTIIDCQRQGRGFSFQSGEGFASVLSGLTITNGCALPCEFYTVSYGGAIYCLNSSPTITGDTITENSGAYGGGIYCENSSAMISNNLLKDNAGSLGGGIFCSGGSPSITGNTITGNSGDWGGGMYLGGSSPSITSNTLSENSAYQGGGIYCGGGSPTIENTIIAFSGEGFMGGGGVGLLCSDSNPTLICCNIYGNVGGDALCGIDGGGNISADPLFCDVGSVDYTLDAQSPCLPENNSCGELIGALGLGCGLKTIALDIKPRSCPNPLNMKPFQNPPDPKIFGNLSMSSNPEQGGVLPAAILGTLDFDVHDIDVSSLLLEGVSPLRHSYEDVAAPVEDGEECECTTAGVDGYMDLTLKFQKSEIAAALGAVSDGDVIPLTLEGQLNDGTPFKGTDCVVIRARKPDPPQFSGPDEVVLYPAVPNPFNPITRIRYHLPREDFVKLAVFDVAGRLVEQLVAGVEGAGEHVAEWDAQGVSSGIYFYRLDLGSSTETRKMILLK
jgi:predicted outer membrane repeat protein